MVWAGLQLTYLKLSVSRLDVSFIAWRYFLYCWAEM